MPMAKRFFIEWDLMGIYIPLGHDNAEEDAVDITDALIHILKKSTEKRGAVSRR